MILREKNFVNAMRIFKIFTDRGFIVTTQLINDVYVMKITEGHLSKED